MQRPAGFEHKAVMPDWGTKDGSRASRRGRIEFGSPVGFHSQHSYSADRPAGEQLLREFLAIQRAFQDEKQASETRVQTIAPPRPGETRYRILDLKEVFKPGYRQAYHVIEDGPVTNLGLGALKIGWFREETERDRGERAMGAGSSWKTFDSSPCIGWMSPANLGEFYLDRALVCRQLTRVAAHEAKHVWQFRHYSGSALEDVPRLQAEADAFADEVEGWHRQACWKCRDWSWFWTDIAYAA